MSSDEDDIVFKKKGKKDKVKSTDDGTAKPKKVDQFLSFDEEEPIAFVSPPKKEKKVSREDKESDSRAKLRARLLAAEGEEEPHVEPPAPVYKPVAHQPRDSAFGTDTFDPFAMAADDYDSGATNIIGTSSLASKYGASAGVIYGSRTAPLDANSNAESSLKLDGSYDISDNISGMAGITLTLAEIEAGKGAHLGLEGDMDEASDEDAAIAARSQAARMLRTKARDGQGVDMSAFTEEEAAEWQREEAREQAELAHDDEAIVDTTIYDSDWSYAEQERPQDAAALKAQKRKEMIKKAIFASEMQDIEHPDWEAEVIRAVTSQSGNIQYGVRESNSNSASRAIPSRSTSSLATDGLRSDQFSPAFSMETLYKALEESVQAHMEEKEDLERQSVRSAEDAEDWVQKKAKAERDRDENVAEWEYYQRASAWFGTLCDCVGIKATTLSALRSRLTSIRTRTTETVTRTRNDGWEWVQEGLWGIGKHGFDAFGRDLALVRKYERKDQEKQRITSGLRAEGLSRIIRTWRENNPDATEPIGYSTDEDIDAAGETNDLLHSLKSEAKSIRDKAKVIFEDADDDYVSLQPMLDRLADWKRRYLDTYMDAHISLSLPYLLLAHVSQDILHWPILSSPRLQSMPWYNTLLQWTDTCVEQTSALRESYENSGKSFRKPHWEFECDPDEDIIPIVAALWVGGFITSYVSDVKWCRALSTDPISESAPQTTSGKSHTGDGRSEKISGIVDMSDTEPFTATNSASASTEEPPSHDSGDVVQIDVDSEEEERAARRRRTREEMEADAEEEERWHQSMGGTGMGSMGLSAGDRSGLGSGMGVSSGMGGLGYGMSGSTVSSRDTREQAAPASAEASGGSRLGTYERVQEQMGHVWEQAMHSKRRAGLGLGVEPGSSGDASGRAGLGAAAGDGMGARVNVGKLSFVRASGADVHDNAMQMRDKQAGTAGDSGISVYTDVVYNHLPEPNIHHRRLGTTSPIYTLPVLVADILMHAHPAPTAPLPPPSRSLLDRSLPLARMLSSIHASILQEVNTIVRRRMLTPEDIAESPQPLGEASSLGKWRVSLRNFHAAIKTLRIISMWRHLLAHMGGHRSFVSSNPAMAGVKAPTASNVDYPKQWFDPYEDKFVTTHGEPASMCAITKSEQHLPQAFTSSDEHRIPLTTLTQALPCHTHMATQVLALPLMRISCLPLFSAVNKLMNRCLSVLPASSAPAQPLDSDAGACLVAAECVWRLWGVVLAMELHQCIPADWGKSGDTLGAGIVIPDVDDYSICPHLASLSPDEASQHTAVQGLSICQSCLHRVEPTPLSNPTTGQVKPSIFTRLYSVTRAIHDKFAPIRALISRIAHYIFENSVAATEKHFTVSTVAWPALPTLVNALAAGQWALLADSDPSATVLLPEDAEQRMGQGGSVGLGDAECVRMVRMIALVASGEFERGFEE